MMDEWEWWKREQRKDSDRWYETKDKYDLDRCIRTLEHCNGMRDQIYVLEDILEDAGVEIDDWASERMRIERQYEGTK